MPNEYYTNIDMFDMLTLNLMYLGFRNIQMTNYYQHMLEIGLYPLKRE